MSVNMGSTTQPVRSKRYKSNNPYLKFLRDPQKHATKWRKPVPIRAKDILNASTMEKSKFITDKIIGDFIKWKESICDSKDVEIDEAVMKQLFEIGESNSVARILLVKSSWIKNNINVCLLPGTTKNLPSADHWVDDSCYFEVLVIPIHIWGAPNNPDIAWGKWISFPV